MQLEDKEGYLIFTSKLNINTFYYQGFMCKKCFGNIRYVLLHCKWVNLITIAVLVSFYCSQEVW